MVTMRDAIKLPDVHDLGEFFLFLKFVNGWWKEQSPNVFRIVSLLLKLDTGFQFSER
jgi:hypothetical protein